jgi:hypothetical protein
VHGMSSNRVRIGIGHAPARHWASSNTSVDRPPMSRS